MRRTEARAERLALEGVKRCARCHEEKPRSEFWANRRSADGRNSWCRLCVNAYVSARRVRKRQPVPSGLKRCARCKMVKPVGEFHRGSLKVGGRVSYCKPCQNEYNRSKYPRKRPPKPPEGFKRCCRCKAVKATDDFGGDRSKPDGKRANCRMCETLKQRAARMDPVSAQKIIVRRFTNDAVRLGVLIRYPCSACGDPNTQAHHTDYAKPLEVQWLCEEHHKGLGHGGDFANPPVPVPVLAMMA